MSRLPIADYALLSDCQSAALVSRAGSIDWLCFPRFDGDAVFARLLDEEGGHWSVQPEGDARVSRRYLPGTLVLETRFETEEGVLELRDLLALGTGQRGHAIGREVPHALLRTLRCVEGSVTALVDYAPRPEYGLVHPLLVRTEEGIKSRGGAAMLRLSAAIAFEVSGCSARARLDLKAGDEVEMALEWRPITEAEPEGWSGREVKEGAEETIRGWRSWSDMHHGYQGPWRELVQHSARVLQALTYAPTGAITAAATTSLPETPGGERNWDYRFCWVRDASFTLDALWVAACPDEADRFFAFLAAAATTQIEREGDLQIMFGVGGEHDLSERELPHLSGWRDSRPVRIGNAAWDQRQLDVYGELLGAAWRLREQLEGKLDEVSRSFLIMVADAAARGWKVPDQGIWEIRGEPQHFVYSKLMCWVALDRAVRMARLLGAEGRVEDWSRCRDEIRAAILDRGFSEEAGAFTQTFDGSALDASNLVMPLVGFLPADDPRIRATIEATVDRLTDARGLVYRYRSFDGLSGEEGTFLLCTFWLAEALAQSGQTKRARETFERAVAYASDLGLLAEQVDAGTGELLGNFPQAFSHIGLINAAWAIEQAEAAA